MEDKAGGSSPGAARHNRRSSLERTEYGLAVLVLVASVFQLYVLPVGSVTLSLGLMSLYVLGAYLIFYRTHTFDYTVILILLLFVMQGASILWSPDKSLGVRDIIYGLPFLFCFLFGRELFELNADLSIQLVKLLCLTALIQSVLVILFRIDPVMESTFMHSWLAGLFINPNTVGGFFTGQADNIVDPAKAGGFLVNGNVAGVWSAMMAFMSMAMSHLSETESERGFWRVVAVIHGVAIIACGSKASLILLILTPVAVTGLIRFASTRSLQTRVAAITGAILVAIAIAISTEQVLLHTSFGKRALFALMTRSALWAFAGEKFLASPILGLGYGGWSLALGKLGAGFDVFGLSTKFPPHNSLILLWAQSGLIALVLGILLIIQLLRIAMSLRTMGQTGRSIAFWSTCVVAFFYLQCLGTNYGILGDPHLQVTLAFFVGTIAGFDKMRRGTHVSN